MIENKIVDDVKWVPINKQLADCLTKKAKKGDLLLDVVGTDFKWFIDKAVATLTIFQYFTNIVFIYFAEAHVSMYRTEEQEVWIEQPQPQL